MRWAPGLLAAAAALALAGGAILAGAAAHAAWVRACRVVTWARSRRRMRRQLAELAREGTARSG
jgi:hypothetical protein